MFLNITNDHASSVPSPDKGGWLVLGRAPGRQNSVMHPRFRADVYFPFADNKVEEEENKKLHVCFCRWKTDQVNGFLQFQSQGLLSATLVTCWRSIWCFKFMGCYVLYCWYCKMAFMSWNLIIQIWSNGIYEPTLHRVINKSPKYRVSLPFFYEVSI